MSKLVARIGAICGVALCLALYGCSSQSTSRVAVPTSKVESPIPCTASSPVTAPALALPVPPATVAMPDAPFGSVSSADGQWIFVSVDGTSPSDTSSAIVVLRREGQSATVEHVIPLSPYPAGEALTHDGRYLIVANYNSVAVLDVAKAEAGQARAVLGTIPTGDTAVTLEVSISPDDHYVFATDEHETPPYVRGGMSVIDLQRALAGTFTAAAVVGQVPLDFYPVGMALAPDGRDLYVTSRFWIAPSSGYDPRPIEADTGSLAVVDVARAEHDPQHAVVSDALAGCGPVRAVLSPSGDVAWVSSQEGNTVLAFDTAKLVSDPHHALVATVDVGSAPTGITFVRQGSELLVACSDRFAGSTTSQSVLVINTQHALQGESAVVGSIAVGAFPREISLDQSLAIVTNYGSQSLSLIDTSTLPA